MTLYSMRSPDIITKFDRDGNVQSSYHCSGDTCDCPAGQRPTCRHRQMWPKLRKIVDSHWFLRFENNEIVDFNGMSKARYDQLERQGISQIPWAIPTTSEPVAIVPPAPIKSWRRI